MSTATHEYHQATLAGVVEPVDEQEVTANVAFTVACPVACQRVIEPFRRQRPIVGDEQHHGLFQVVHVVSAGVRQVLPVLEEILCVI